MTQLGTKKSRHGCNHCKRRRVKCDERTPCTNCSRRGETCSLLYPPLTDRSNNGTTTLDSADWLQDLELMHHWSRRTSTTQLGGGAATQTIWGEFVPREAMKHRFLMHGILAITSLHMATEAMSEAIEAKYMKVHEKHLSIALDSSRAIMANINGDSGAALFAFSSITSLSALSKSVIKAKRGPEPRCISIDDMAGCMALTRGVREIVAASIQALLASPMSALLTGYEVHCNVRIMLPKHINDRISLLQRMLSEHCTDTEKHSFCSTAIQSLQQVYRNIFYFMDRDTLGVGHIWRFTALVDTEFIQLVQSQYQPALVIVSYFACTCHFLRTEWFMQEWGRYVFNTMKATINAEFQHLLEWPQEQFATDCAAFRQGDATIENLDGDAHISMEQAIMRVLMPILPLPLPKT